MQRERLADGDSLDTFDLLVTALAVVEPSESFYGTSLDVVRPADTFGIAQVGTDVRRYVGRLHYVTGTAEIEIGFCP
ncbi:hypothetical protein M0R89_22880 (plasmid) [Halorussus limi]|uniref:Uncharacterized protein n=1 Tax=Halorussus limi TaxID=2938695 RepID=A0A8U0I200_9EURY|nr:hypothetical protein [Halorussus limi]UPV77218.1 hypothetical protein M0R89_22880 [Halorussus limi]